MAVHLDPFLIPPGVTSIFIRLYGGGANGQGGANPPGAFFGAGGGGGAFVSAVLAVTPGLTYTAQWSDSPGQCPVGTPASPGGPAVFRDPATNPIALADAGQGAFFPGEAGGVRGQAALSTGDLKQDGFDGQPGGFALATPGGDGGNGAPPEGGLGGMGSLVSGSDGGIPSAGGGAGGSNAGPGTHGGDGTPSSMRIWDNRNGDANGFTNTPPPSHPVPIAEFGTGLPPIPPNPKLRKAAFMMA